MLPTFVIIGAMKSGTTSLYEYLASHPQVFMARPKELNFFIAERNWTKGLEWYRARFENGSDALARGEASPNYSKAHLFPGVPERMARVIPDARLIYLIRNPPDMIRSMYAHRVAHGRERRSLEEAVLSDSYIDTALYAFQIERFLERFDRSQLLVLQSERLRMERLDTLRKIHLFIGVEPLTQSESLDNEFHRGDEMKTFPNAVFRMRASRMSPYWRAWVPRRVRLAVRGAVRRPSSAFEMPEWVSHKIAERVSDDVGRLRALIGPDFDGWGLA